MKWCADSEMEEGLVERVKWKHVPCLAAWFLLQLSMWQTEN